MDEDTKHKGHRALVISHIRKASIEIYATQDMFNDKCPDLNDLDGIIIQEKLKQVRDILTQIRQLLNH